MIVKTKLTQVEYDEIKVLVNQALSALNKAGAEEYINSLKFLALDFEGSVHSIK